MSSKKEVERLLEDNRVLSQRLSEAEFELSKKEENLKNANQSKSSLLTDVRDYQCTVRDLKKKLERAESAELEAKSAAHDNHTALEAAESNLRDKTCSSKSVISSLQQTINSLKSKLAEKEDKYDDLAATLQLKEELLNSLSKEKTKIEKEAQSRMLNQNQALVQAKQTCNQLTEQVEVHQRKQFELAQTVEDLQQAGAQGVRIRTKIHGASPVQSSAMTPSRVFPPVATPSRVFPSVATPSRVFMSAATVESSSSLLVENKKLKQDLSCLQTNFELTSRKSAHLRGQAKEMESSLVELQNLFDKTLAEKEALQSKLDELNEGLEGRAGQRAAEKERLIDITQEVERLHGEVERLQKRNLELGEKLQSGAHRTLESQGMMTQLDSVKQSLVDEKQVMQEEMTALRTEFDRLQDMSHGLTDSSNVHQEDSKKKSRTISALKSKVSKLTKERSALSGQLEEASEKLDRAFDKIRLQKDEITALGANLKAKNGKILMLGDKEKDQSHLPVEVEKLRAKVIETVEELAELRSKNDGHVQAREKLEARASELSKANAKLQREGKHSSEMARRMNTELEKLEEKMQTMEADCEARGRERDVAQRKLKDAKTELSGAANAKSGREDETRELVRKLGEIEQQNFELTTKLAGMQREAATVTGKYSNVEQKLSDFEANLDAAEFAILEKDSHISDLKCAYELMESENSTLLSQVTSLSEMVSMRNFKLESHQMQTVRQESDIFEIMEKISELEMEHGGCTGVIQKLRVANEALEADLEKGTASLRDVKGKVSSLELDVKELEKSIVLLKASSGDLRDENTALAAKSRDLGQKCVDVSGRVRQLERELRMETLTVVTAREDLTHANKTRKDSEDKMAETIEALEMKRGDLELQCSGFAQQKVELKSRILELRRDMKEQVLLCSALQIEKDSLTEQFEAFKLSALSVVQSDYGAGVAASRRRRENPPPSLSSSKEGKQMKSILKKKPRSRKVLHPVQDLLD